MSIPGHPAARGHLRLAGPPASRRPIADRRLALWFRAGAAFLGLAFSTLFALAASAVALAPLAWRRTPVGARLRPLRPREARIIPFQRPAPRKASTR